MASPLNSVPDAAASNPPPAGKTPSGRAFGDDDFGLYQGCGGIWHSDFYRGVHRIRRSTGTADLGEALRTCARWNAGGLEALPRPRNLRHTLADLEAALEQEHRIGRISSGTLRIYLDRIRFFRQWHRDTYQSEVALHRIDRPLIKTYIRWREETPVTRNGSKNGQRHLPTKRTVAHDLDTFRALFRRAISLGWMTEEPTKGVPRDRLAYRPRVRALGPEDMRAFLSAVKRLAADEPRTKGSGIRLLPEFCEATFVCGLRREETRMLTREDIDLRRGVVHVRGKTLALTVVLPMDAEHHKLLQEALAADRRCQRPRIPEYMPTEVLRRALWHPQLDVLVGDVAVTWRPKGGSREREVPISPRAVALFERLMKTDLADWYPGALAVTARQHLGIPSPSLLFPGAEGGLLRSNMNNEVNKAARAAGLKNLRIHDLRHSFATQLRSENVELSTIQSLLGHEDLETTQMYAHYTDREGRRAVDALRW